MCRVGRRVDVGRMGVGRVRQGQSEHFPQICCRLRVCSGPVLVGPQVSTESGPAVVWGVHLSPVILCLLTTGGEKSLLALGAAQCGWTGTHSPA